MNNRMNKKIFYLLFIFLLTPLLCYGNVGVPVIALTYPGFIILLIPIIFIEYLIIRSALKVAKRLVLKSTIISNIISTLIGVPLAWGLLLLLELLTTGGSVVNAQGIFQLIGSVILQSAWLIPFAKHLHWMLPTAIIINLVPAYFLSKYSEYFFTKKIIKNIEAQQIKKAVFKANNITYVLLLAISLGYLIINLSTRTQFI